MIEITSLSQYENAIKSAKVSVIDFYADWCGPCKAVAPGYARLAESKKNVATFYKCNVDNNQDVSQHAGVSAMPTFAVYKGGKQVASVRGADLSAVDRAITQHGAAPTAFVSGGHLLTNKPVSARASQSLSHLIQALLCFFISLISLDPLQRGRDFVASASAHTKGDAPPGPSRFKRFGSGPSFGFKKKECPSSTCG